MQTSPKAIWQKISPVLLKTYKRDATFLDYRNPWELTVAVILSAQTTDNGVNKITPILFKRYPTPRALAKADTREIEKIIRPVGYYKTKARYIQESAKILLKDFHGIVPRDAEAIQKLRGVGRKSAVAILSNAYEQNIGIPVDTHVIRFVKRFGLSKAKDPSKIEQELLAIIPKKDWKRAGYAIKEYGRREGKALGYRKELDPLQKVL